MSGGPLDGRAALVTGASRGIGAATAAALSGAGARVARTARSLRRERRGPCANFPCDLTKADEVQRTVDEVVAAVGVPDILVHCAGAFLLRSLEDTPPEAFAEILRVNVCGAFLVLRALAPYLRQHGRGHVVTVGSIADYRPLPGNAAYAASKYGLRGLHDVAALELRPAGVRFTLISPGPTDTALWDDVDPDRRPDLPSRSAMLRPGDVADAVLFAVTRPAHVHIELLRLGPA